MLLTTLRMFSCILSQMVTYLVCDGLEYRFKVLIGRVRQATKDVVKSDVTTLRSNSGCNTVRGPLTTDSGTRTSPLE